MCHDPGFCLQRLENSSGAIAGSSYRDWSSCSGCLPSLMGQARTPLQTVEAQEFVVKDAGEWFAPGLGHRPPGQPQPLSRRRTGESRRLGRAGQAAHLPSPTQPARFKGLLLLNPETVGLYRLPSTPPSAKSPRVVFSAEPGYRGFAFFDKKGVARPWWSRLRRRYLIRCPS